MRVLVACEFSGVVRDAFLSRGHDAWSCDILPTESDGPHILGNVLNHLDRGWDLMIAHPPCTYLTNAGVRHLHSVPSRNGVVTRIHGEERWLFMRASARFFCQLKNAPIPRICVENPTPHRYAREIIGEYQQAIQPWMFDEPYTKRTCLWLINLPNLIPTVIRQERFPQCHMTPPSKDRGKIRSVTYKGIADAMAEQWGSL